MKQFFKKVVVSILTWEAKMVLSRYKPKVVAVTGSVGKTGTKDAIYTLLASSHYARKSEKSFNSELGVPLTILGLPNAWSSFFGWFENIFEGLAIMLFKHDYPEWLVLECGADRPGDLKALAWLKPQIVVYTRFPNVPVHVEYFESPEAVIAEKRELARALTETGTLIVNADDEKMVQEQVSERQRVLSYGFSEHATVRGLDPEILEEHGRPLGMACNARFQTDEARLTLKGALGVHQLYPLLAALTVAISEGKMFKTSVAELEKHIPPAGRMRILDGKESTILIDDTYNASPAAMKAALDTLGVIQSRGKKIAVLGDMMELGDFSVAAHESVGAHVADVADVFVAVGVRMKGAAEKARSKKGKCKHVFEVQDATEALALLHERIQEGDTVYIKGSQSMRMEQLMEGLLRDSASAPTVLVRQDKEWKKR